MCDTRPHNIIGTSAADDDDDDHDACAREHIATPPHQPRRCSAFGVIVDACCGSQLWSVAISFAFEISSDGSDLKLGWFLLCR
jgi:hypothetical protein